MDTLDHCRIVITRNVFLRFLLVGLAVAAVEGVAIAQPKYSAVRKSSIAGLVTDETGLAIQASVPAVSGPSVFNVLTGSGGTFVLAQLPTGSYSLCGVATASTWDADPLKASPKA